MHKFTEDFLLGAATAAHQVEGNNTHSDYWALEQMKYSGFAEPSLDAVDHYHHYEEDISLLAKAGCNAYRFSIEWARIEPEKGKYDEGEIEHYRQVLRCCKRNGIEPIVTMHHFSSPKWLIEQGGWEDEKTIDAFADYCQYVVSQLGREMKYVCTINEANMGLQIAAISAQFIAQMQENAKKQQNEQSNTDNQLQIGMNLEEMMAGMKLGQAENREVFGTETPQVFVGSRTKEGDLLIMKAHQAARAAMKEKCPHLEIGLTLSLHDLQAVDGGEARVEQEWEEEFRHYLPYIKDDDFFGLQNYTRTIMGPEGARVVPEGARTTQMDYEDYPQALEHVIRKVYQELPIPILVTENGIATADDGQRQRFIEQATDGVAACLKDQIPVKGYMYWSLLDNFEWQKGYDMTFGLIKVDRSTQIRYPKESLKLLGQMR